MRLLISAALIPIINRGQTQRFISTIEVDVKESKVEYAFFSARTLGSSCLLGQLGNARIAGLAGLVSA
jgi:hypothetical protein